MFKHKKIFLWLLLPAAIIGSYLVVDQLLFDGFRPHYVEENGLQAVFFAKTGLLSQATVILIGGGQEGEYWASQFADSGLAALSLPYTRREGLPALPEEIPLEYVETALDWLAEQPEVDPQKIVVMGASRNAELALVAASTLPDRIQGVIAIAPSSVSWSNRVLPFNSDELKPSWTYQGEAIPFLPMDKIQGDGSGQIQTLPYWQAGLAKLAEYPEAQIPVEQIKGPILLLSGKDDQVWPAAEMANQIEQRLAKHSFPYDVKNIQYEQAGHLLSRSLETVSVGRVGTLNLNGVPHSFSFGGTVAGDKQAIREVRGQIFAFLGAL